MLKEAVAVEAAAALPTYFTPRCAQYAASAAAAQSVFKSLLLLLLLLLLPLESVVLPQCLRAVSKRGCT
jgi:hypothetical protein